MRPRSVHRWCGNKDGCARRIALAGPAVQRSLSPHLAADDGGTRSSATGLAAEKLVWMRNAIGNQLYALALGGGVCRKKKLFTMKGRVELESLSLDQWASRRRQELLRLVDQLDASRKEFDQAVAEQAEQSEAAVLLMTHPRPR